MRSLKVFALGLAMISLLTASFTPTQAAQGKQTNSKGIRYINPPTLSTPKGYTHVVAVSAGQTVYIAGQVPLDKDGKLVGAGDFGAQVRQTFENLKSALAAADATFADVVKVTIFVTDASQIDKFRQVRNEYFKADPPASTFVEVKALFRPDVMIEIDAIAQPMAW
jgi:reactive intermediate/imine deaminase